MDRSLEILSETAYSGEYLIATYYIKLSQEIDVIKKAEQLALGQTVGTWVEIPGVTEEIREKYMGKVVDVVNIPPAELSIDQNINFCEYLVKIGYPSINYANDFPLFITSLLGNDASTSAQVKLMDINFPESFISQFSGPKYGIENLRKNFKVQGRPILLNMIKPCLGLTPKEASNVFYYSALGGSDIIKDDELMGNPFYSDPAERVEEFKKAAQRAYNKTGHKTYYFVNITSGVTDIQKNLKRVEDAGADGIMINFAVVGYSMLNYVAAHTKLPVLGHSAGAGTFFEGLTSGLSSPLAIGKLARLAGADIVMVNTPYGGYPLIQQKYLQTIKQLTFPFFKLKDTIPAVGGGVNPGVVEKYIHELGSDIILAAGGAIQGHPDGAVAGATAMRQAIDIVMSGNDFEKSAGAHEELSRALRKFPYVK